MSDLTEVLDSLSHRLLSIEIEQCNKLNALLFCDPVQYIYSPLEYAYDIHANFVHKFCKSPKKVLFLGMNPGPWGMSQTGVPFGEVKIVKEWLKLSGHVDQPQKEHPSRPVLGLECKRSEVSGRKFWGLFQKLCGDPDIFFQNAFVSNYCPLAFMTKTGKNITPEQLKASERRAINEICDKALCDVLQLLQVEVIVAVGKYAEKRANAAIAYTELKDKIQIGSIPHPSPRNLSSKNWPEDTCKRLQEMEILTILCRNTDTIPEQQTCIFSSVGPTQPPVQWTRGAVSPEAKGLVCETTISLQLLSKLKTVESNISTSPYMALWHDDITVNV